MSMHLLFVITCTHSYTSQWQHFSIWTGILKHHCSHAGHVPLNQFRPQWTSHNTEMESYWQWRHGKFRRIEGDLCSFYL